MPTAQSIATVSALVLVTACMFTDLSKRRIPNVLTLPAVVIGLILGLVGGGWEGLLLAFAGMLVGLGLMFLPYYLGGMGAGDVKLMAAVGALFGFPAVIDIFLYTALAGGAVALIVTLRQRIALKALKNSFSMIRSFVLSHLAGAKSQAGGAKPHKSIGAIPYGVAIAFGTYAYYWFGGIL
jgi:prepilin peptidase CpaA